MFDLLKMNRINKITATHSEKISDYMILMQIVNSTSVQNTVTSEEFSRYRGVFQAIASRKDEQLTNSLQYEHRAFRIAYELEEATGIPYQKMCGSATEILYMYSNRKPQFEQAVSGATQEAMTIVQNVIKATGSGDLKIFAYIFILLRCLLIQLASQDDKVYENKITMFMLDKVVGNVYRNINEIFKLQGTRNGQVFDDYCNEIVKINKEAINNTRDYDTYLDSLINSVLFLCNDASDLMTKHMIIDWINKWRQ